MYVEHKNVTFFSKIVIRTLKKVPARVHEAGSKVSFKPAPSLHYCLQMRVGGVSVVLCE